MNLKKTFLIYESGGSIFDLLVSTFMKHLSVPELVPRIETNCELCDYRLHLFCFHLSLQLRMEKLAAKSRSSKAKVMGSIISIAGAFVLTFYKGPSIMNSSSLHQSIGFLKSVDSNWDVIAGILLIVDYFLSSLWYILVVSRVGLVLYAK